MLNGDMNKLDGQIRKITNQMKNSSTEPDVVSQMEEFLPVSSPTLYLTRRFHDNQKQTNET